MKKIVILLLALMMVLSLAACGGNKENPSGGGTGGTSQQQPGGTSNNSPYETALSETQLAKIDSFGKCEENKKIVAVNDFSNEHYVKVCVYTWSDPKAVFDEYSKYYFFESADAYNQYKERQGDYLTILEDNEAENWFCAGLDENASVGQIGLKTYSDIYNYCAHGTGGDLIE